MFFSLVANLISLYGLVAWPVPTSQLIDFSRLAEGGKIDLIKTVYQENTPYRLNNQSLGMKVTAQAALAVDQKSGAVLWQKNARQQRSLASITKLATALVFLENNPGWETEVTIQKSDYRAGGRSYIYSGEKISLKDLFNISLVASSNHATMALARATGLSAEDFVARMNNKAKELGMKQTTFIEPTGLDPANVATAEDIISLARAAFLKPEIKSATIQSEYVFKVLNNQRSEKVKNTDKLLGSYLKVLAGKTGYLDEAGYCLVSLVGGEDSQELLMVVLGSATEADRFQDLKALAQWAFDNYLF